MHRTRNKLLSWIDTIYLLSQHSHEAKRHHPNRGGGLEHHRPRHVRAGLLPPLRRRVRRDGGGGGAFAALGMVSAYGQTSTGGRVNVNDEYGQRDVYAMEEWASQYGVQRADGVQ